MDRKLWSLFGADGTSQLFQFLPGHHVRNIFLESASSIDLKGGSES
jgi:hypothetical protein